MCVPSHPRRPQYPRSPHHRAHRRPHLFLKLPSRRHPTLPLTPRSVRIRRHLTPVSTRPRQSPNHTPSHTYPRHPLPPACTSTPHSSRQACSTTCVTNPPSQTRSCREPFSSSPRRARPCLTCQFASLVSRGNASFGLTPPCRLATQSSPSKTSSSCSTITSAFKSRETSTMLWARRGRWKFSRHSSGASGMTRLSGGRGSDVSTSWVAAYTLRASYELSRRTMSGTSSSVEFPHRCHLERDHHQTKKEKKCIICYLPTNPGATTPSEVLYNHTHHSPPLSIIISQSIKHLTSIIHPPSVHYPFLIFPTAFLTRSWTLFFFFILISIRNTIRLSMLPCPSLRHALLTCCRLAVLTHTLRIVLRTLC